MIWAWEGAKPHMASNTTNDQPHPAATEAAAWSDGELIGSLLNGAVDLFIARGNQHTTTAIETRMADQYAELQRRLTAAATPSGQVVVDAELVRQASTAARLVANWGDDKHPLDRSYWNGLADRLSALTGADR